MGGRLEQFELTVRRVRSGSRQQSTHLFLRERLEGASRFECLIENFRAVDSSDHDGSRQIESVVEAIDGRDNFAFEDDVVSHRFHAEYAYAILDQFRQHQFREAAKMSVHDVERHLDGIEVEAMFGRDFQHVEMDMRILVSGESDVAGFASFAGVEHSFLGATLGEDTVGVFEADDLVMLDEIDVIGLQALKRLV